MKLYYFKDPNGNFGDDLNPWLWEKILPNFFDDDEGEIFVGIGTLLNHRIPVGPVKHIFGSGFGYGRPPVINERFIVHAVRGYETARALHLDDKLVITDAAVLLRAVTLPKSDHPQRGIGFIPHCQSIKNFEWIKVCDELGLKYISPEWSIETVLKEISSCKMVICEAMHGAIVADTLRIPWVPVYCYDHISEFKWRDWLSTLDIRYNPLPITSLYDAERGQPLKKKFKNIIKRTLRKARIWSTNWTSPPRAKTGTAEFDRAASELHAASTSPPFLSEDKILERHIERYEDALHTFKARRSYR